MVSKIKLRILRWFESKRYNLKKYDYALVAVVMTLSMISSFVLTIIGATSLKRQLFVIFGGFLIIVVVSFIDYHTVCSYAIFFYIIATILVACTRFSPIGSKGTTDSYRWLDLKFIMFQPSEICKVVVIITLAAFFVKKQDELDKFKTFFMGVGLVLLPTFFIMVQSDLSSSVVILIVAVMMFINSGMGRKIFGPVVLATIPLSIAFIWYIQQPFQKLLDDYQIKRFTGWLHPEEEALNTMYQQNNSVLSIASGKFSGKYLLDATQTRNYHSVDVIESDFIWTPIGEEFGFVGCLIILILLSIIVIKCFLTAKKAKDYLGMLISIGIGSMFCFQIFFNIGVATSLLPNTGLPLPFLSNGLSSLLSSSIAIGILINIQLQPTRGATGSFVEEKMNKTVM